MNKHQFSAIAVAILAIFGSLYLWTHNVEKIDFPDLTRDLRDSVEEIVNSIFKEVGQKTEVSVVQVEVEDLGNHFVESVEQTKVEAALIEMHDSKLLEPIPEPEPTVEVEEEEVTTPEPQHAAASELDHWQLSHVWRISIPSLSIRAPVLMPSMKYWSTQAWGMLEEQMQVGLNHGTVAYPHSSGPGSKGSLIVAGHSSPPTKDAEESNFGHVFSRLPDIAIGEEITVATAGSPIVYKVEEKFVVSPSMTSILEQQHDESILKLITCYPVGTTKDRMIVLAKKVD